MLGMKYCRLCYKILDEYYAKRWRFAFWEDMENPLIHVKGECKLR